MENNQRISSTPHLAKPVLCDGFLTPMTDFILRINEIEKEIDQFFDSWRMKQLRIIENYAKFLKQPLKLEMFVPCDEDGNLFGEPEIYSQWVRENFNDELENEERINQCKDYHQAKEKVLFEGIEFERISGVNFLKINEDTFAFHDFNIKFKNLTVEFLVQYNLQLTESTIKQIGHENTKHIRK